MGFGNGNHALQTGPWGTVDAHYGRGTMADWTVRTNDAGTFGARIDEDGALVNPRYRGKYSNYAARRPLQQPAAVGNPAARQVLQSAHTAFGAPAAFRIIRPVTGSRAMRACRRGTTTKA